MMTSQSKKRFESCYKTFIDCMIYSVLLFRTETFNSYRLCEKVFASDWESQLVYSQSIIWRLMIRRNESIKTLNANLKSTAITCRTTELNKYLWWNSATISISSQSSQWFLSTSIKIFTFEWVSIQIRLTTKPLMNDWKLEKQMILSFKWKSYWALIINNWKRRSWLLKHRINKHKRDVIYEINDWVWLFFKNVKIMRSCKDLKDKQLESYQITVKAKIFYHLHLLVSMKHLHSMFSLKLLQSYSENSLSEQHAESLRLIIIDNDNDEHWEINDILNFRRYQGWIQYKIKWKDLDKDNEWYYVDKDEFNDFEKVLNEFHTLYSRKSR